MPAPRKKSAKRQRGAEKALQSAAEEQERDEHEATSSQHMTEDSQVEREIGASVPTMQEQSLADVASSTSPPPKVSRVDTIADTSAFANESAEHKEDAPTSDIHTTVVSSTIESSQVALPLQHDSPQIAVVSSSHRLLAVTGEFSSSTADTRLDADHSFGGVYIEDGVCTQMSVAPSPTEAADRDMMLPMLMPPTQTQSAQQQQTQTQQAQVQTQKQTQEQEQEQGQQQNAPAPSASESSAHLLPSAPPIAPSPVAAPLGLGDLLASTHSKKKRSTLIPIPIERDESRPPPVEQEEQSTMRDTSVNASPRQSFAAVPSSRARPSETRDDEDVLMGESHHNESSAAAGGAIPQPARRRKSSHSHGPAATVVPAPPRTKSSRVTRPTGPPPTFASPGQTAFEGEGAGDDNYAPEPERISEFQLMVGTGQLLNLFAGAAALRYRNSPFFSLPFGSSLNQDLLHGTNILSEFQTAEGLHPQVMAALQAYDPDTNYFSFDYLNATAEEIPMVLDNMMQGQKTWRHDQTRCGPTSAFLSRSLSSPLLVFVRDVYRRVGYPSVAGGGDVGAGRSSGFVLRHAPAAPARAR